MLLDETADEVVHDFHIFFDLIASAFRHIDCRAAAVPPTTAASYSFLFDCRLPLLQNLTRDVY